MSIYIPYIQQGLVYHIPDPNNKGLDFGYIGVVLKEKGAIKRFHEHRTSSSHMRSKIKKNNITENDVQIIFEGDIKDCYNKEQELRPIQRMGWNVDRGGRGYYYISEIDNLSEYRSRVQTLRMQDEELKKCQGENFKKNYYASPESIELRQRRAKEHMSNPEKREKCLTALHTKKQCPNCGYEGNAGNVAQHIKKYCKEMK